MVTKNTTKTTKRPNLGGHVSAAGGLHTAIERAVELGAETFQIHATSPRQWKAKMPDEEVIEKFREGAKEAGIDRHYIHAPYLINLASPDEILVARSRQNLADNLRIGEAIGATGVIFHLGSSKGGDKNEAMKQEAASVKKILEEVDGSCMLLLENAAGGGDKIGATLTEIGFLLEAIDSARAGVCFDTAHAFEAGILQYDDPKVIKEFFDLFDKQIGLDKLICMHINDSKTEFNSQHDRHENIGDGHIGIQGFKNLAAEERLYKSDWCLEVPGIEGEGPDPENIKRLHKLFE